MKRGVCTCCLPTSFSLRQQFELAHIAGFDGIELIFGDKPEFGPQSSDDDLRAVAAMSGETIPVMGMFTGALWKTPLTDPNAEIRAQGMVVVQQMIHAATLLGVDAILVVPGMVTPTVSYHEAYERAQDALHHLAPLARESGVTLCIENVWNRFLLSPLEMARFVDEIGSDAIACYFDVGNILAYGYPEDWIRTLGPRIKRVHLKDFAMAVGNYSGFRYLLEGDVNWPVVMEALRSIGYDGYVTAELSPYQHAPASTAADIADRMARIIAMAQP